MTYLSWINVTPLAVELEINGTTDLEALESICNLLGQKKILNFLDYQKRRYRIHTYISLNPELDPDEVVDEYP